MVRPHIALIIPVHNEAEVIGWTLDELMRVLPQKEDYTISVGLNATTDRSEEIIRERNGVLIGHTESQGYGHGCLAAIEATRSCRPLPDAYLFLSGDGAHDPRDIPLFRSAFEEGWPFVLGSRTRHTGLRPWHRSASNRVLGAWAALLSGHWFDDLGPFRLIARPVFDQLALSEYIWGWTIEAQILAARLGIPIQTVAVTERPRQAGSQKVSGVSLSQTLRIGAAIARAGWRSARRPLPAPVAPCQGPTPLHNGRDEPPA